MATSDESAFPDITFKVFSAFINLNFSSKITLTTVLLLLFTMTDNPDLLSLHACQQHPACPSENNTKLSAWIRSLSRGICNWLDDHDVKRLFKKHKNSIDKVPVLAEKLDSFAKILKLTLYSKDGHYTGQLKPISHKEIQPVLVICPNSIVCEDVNSCKPRGLLQSTEIQDIPLVTFIKGTTIHKNVMALGGKCSKCQTTYQADHECVLIPGQDTANWVYVNSAKYLKIGQNTWVDHIFSSAILNAMYSFHVSASAYTEYWNNRFGEVDGEIITKITQRQVWQGSIQESIRMVAAESNTNLTITDGLSISEKTKAAFEKLWEIMEYFMLLMVILVLNVLKTISIH